MKDNDSGRRASAEPALVADATGAASVSAHSGDGQAHEEDDTLSRIYEAGFDSPWEANDDGLWCPACGDIIAPLWFFERDDKYEPPESCRACGFPDYGG